MKFIKLIDIHVHGFRGADTRGTDPIAMFGNEPIPLSTFFARYAEISDDSEDKVLVYEVVRAGE